MTRTASATRPAEAPVSSTQLDQSSLTVLAEVADLGFFQVDGERNIVDVSPALERITGFTKEEVLGRSCLTMMRCQECLQGCGVFRLGTVHDHKITLYRKDGSEVEVSKSGTALRNSEGEIVGAIETVRPVSESEATGFFTDTELDSLLDSLGRVYILASADLEVLSASAGLSEITGIPSNDLRGMCLPDLLGGDLFGPDGAFVRSVLGGERREGWRATLPRAAGGELEVSVTAGPVSEGTRCAASEAALFVMMRPEPEPIEEASAPERRNIIARSQPMQRIFRLVELLRENDSTVLITGESGTGKEVVARALHESSHRSKGPMVAINCAAIPAELLESELFGHVKGAFTGAVRDRPGRFELADGGTIFLDEIADLALPLQAKLLRVLQEHEFERVGGTKTRKVDVRVIAATNQNLQVAVANNRFREDLYYRLRVVPIDIPPLRNRREDLDPLIRHLMRKIGRDRGRALRLAPSAMRALLTYPWPGNVREMENALEYAMAVCEGQTIHLEDLPLEIGLLEENGNGTTGQAVGARHPLDGRVPLAHPASPAGAAGGLPPTGGPAIPAPQPGSRAVVDPVVQSGPGVVRLSDQEIAEADRIRVALEEAHYSRQKAADLLGMSRTTLWRKMRQYHLD
jgi:PAS domain S-box-containing protein